MMPAKWLAIHLAGALIGVGGIESFGAIIAGFHEIRANDPWHCGKCSVALNSDTSPCCLG
jgi:hypothetical protein